MASYTSKNSENLDFTVVFLKQKRRSATKKFKFLGVIWNSLVWFRYIFLEVSARVSLKVVTKGVLEVKNFKNLNFTVVSRKQKRRSATKKFEVSLLNL